jgi:dethiobiotin synthetase
VIRAAKRIRGLLVTGTGTGVGKTVVASAIAARLSARGERVAVFKPAVTGLDEPDGSPPDHELLRASARSTQEPDDVAPYRFGPAVSPHLAAESAGVRIEPSRLLERAAEAAAGADALIAEGVGGLMVPLAGDYLIRDFAIDLDLPLVIAANPGLGTINHTLLTLEAARAVGLDVASVVLTPWPQKAGELERSNRAVIATLGRVEVATLPRIDISSPQRVLGELPIQSWLARSGSGGREEAAASA